MVNADVQLTLDDGVAEVLNILTGLDLSYDPRLDRYYSITRAINRALRANALEHEWSYYHSMQELGPVSACTVAPNVVYLSSNVRARMVLDDAIQLCDPETGRPVLWAYFLSRDALHKYAWENELRASVTRNAITFSRPFTEGESELLVKLPVMREPIMFRLPVQPEDDYSNLADVPVEIRQQLLDFDYPDIICQRAAYYVAQTDPVMQPRAQTLEANFKDLMYQLVERDDKNTDSPYQNPWTLGISGDLHGEPGKRSHLHPHADNRYS